MGIMDRIRDRESQQQMEKSPEDSSSTTLERVDPVTKRMTGVLRGLMEMYEGWKTQGEYKNDFLVRQMHIILSAIVEELEEDQYLFSNPTGQLWILQFAKLMQWTVTGDHSELPPELQKLACKIEGVPYEETTYISPEPLVIENAH
jgi:hypothetical protein